MKSANSRTRLKAGPLSGLRLSLVAPLCLLALVCGLVAGGSRSSAAAFQSAPQTGQKTKADAATLPADAEAGKGRDARSRAARPGGTFKPAGAKAGRDADPLIFGCGNPDTPIAIGGPALNGTLSSGDCVNPVDGSLYDAYTFTGSAGQFVTISMTSTAFDTYLYLVRPNETALSYRTIQDDDGAGGESTDSRIVAVLPESGVYTIMANSAFSGLTGSYTVQVRGGCTATGINHNTTTSNTGLAAPDCQLPDNSFVDAYSFTAVAGQQVRITMRSTAFDTFLFLLSKDGFTELARNDDGTTGGPPPSPTQLADVNSRIPSRVERSNDNAGYATLPAAGTYYILANAFSPGAGGAYTLQLEVLPTLCPAPAITAGQTVNGQIATSDCRLPFDSSYLDVYTFSGTAGQQIAVTMTSIAPFNPTNPLNPFLLLYDPEGFLLDENNDGAGAPNARIPDPADGQFVTLPVDGTYRIYANAAVPDQVGNYSLTVTGAASCTVTLAQTSRPNVAAAGGTFTDTFNVPAGCPVPAFASGSAFITNVTGSVNASGQGSFTYTVAANTTDQARTGTITVGGQTFTVTQGANCAVTISPAVRPFLQAGGAGRFTVVPAVNACQWAASTTASWITINSGASGTGVGRVTYTVAANATASTRTGTITVNGQTHTVTQTATGTTPTVAFKFATFAVNEADPSRSITLTVSRLGDTSGAVTVEYRTVFETQAQSEIPCKPAQGGGGGGTAFGRCDFATTVDTLTFAAGEVEKSFTIPLINDVHVEGAETFQVELADPRGATLGAPATATVTINDDDTAQPTTNPVRPPLPYGPETPRFFVRMQYLDFLSREPEPSEPWTGVLLRAGCNPETPPSVQTDCDRIGVSRAFFESDESRLKGRFVFLYHKASFGSAANPNYFPEYRDYVTDLQRVTGATSAETLARRFDFSEEWVNRTAFTARYAGLSNAQFVDTLLANVNTTLTQAARNSLVADLDANTRTRADVLRLIVESPEVSAQQFNHAYVATQYYGYLRRTPDLSGYLAWLNAINQNRDNLRVMVDGFMNSTEYVNRFGPN